MPDTRHLADMSSTARRTRKLIIDSAIMVLAERATATLAEIAESADVSRSTLHRHFADRKELLAAIDAECRVRFGQAAESARLDEGSALDRLDRLAQEYLGLDTVLGLVFVDNAPVDPDSWEGDDHGGGMAAVIASGQRNAEIDPDMSSEWVEVIFWTLLFGAWLSLQNGMSRRDVAFQLSRTVRKAFGTSTQ